MLLRLSHDKGCTSRTQAVSSSTMTAANGDGSTVNEAVTRFKVCLLWLQSFVHRLD